MEITKQALSELEKFQTDLSNYHDVANSIWAATNGHEYVSDTELTKRREEEKRLRSKLNVDYGSISDYIDGIMGSRPMMVIPSMPGARWDIFPEALAARFSVTKGECLQMAEQTMDIVVGRAKKIYKNPPANSTKQQETVVFTEELLGRVGSIKIKELCKELNRVWPQNPNSTALLMRTILLVTLQQKIGTRAKEDLGSVLNQAISQDIYKDVQVKKILSNFAAMPKVLLDATHHSQWILLKADDIRHWLPGLIKVIEATYLES